MNDQQIEQEIQAKGLTAPRVTPDDIEANIASEHYFTAADGYRSAPCFDPNGQPADCLPSDNKPVTANLPAVSGVVAQLVSLGMKLEEKSQ